MEAKPLFTRLGGTAGIRAIVDDIVALHMENPAISPRFRPYLEQPDKLAVTKKHLSTFLESGGGGPAKYEGRPMREAHRGMNISPGEYMAAIDDILATLKKHKIDDATQAEVLAIAWSLKGEIVSV